MTLILRGGRGVALLTLTVVATLAACSSSEDAPATIEPVADGGLPDTAPPLTPSIACTTLHRKLQRPNPDYYRVFASDQEAFVFSQTFLPSIGRKAPLAPGDALQKQGQALTDRAYAALSRLYPDDVAGMPGPPRVLVIDDDRLNAFATIDTADATDRSPWVFYVHRGALQQYASDLDGLMGVMAHELGHLVVKNVRPEVKAVLGIYYAVPSASEDGVFGTYQTTDPLVKATAEKIIAIGSYCGQLTEAELNGYPFTLGQGEGGPTDSSAAFVDWLNVLKTQAPAGNATCTKAFAGEAAIKALIGQKANVDTDIVLGADAPKLDALTKAFGTDIATCLSATTAPLLNVAAASFKRTYPKQAAAVDSLLASDPDLLAQKIRAVPARAIDLRFPTGVTVTKLLQISKEYQAALRAIVEDPKTNYPALRHYFTEDEADDVSARVITVLGLPMQKAADSFMSVLPKAVADDCRAKITAGKRIGYGGFVDTHHSYCWRAYRALQLEKAFATCGAGWPENAAAAPKPFGDGGS